MQFPLGGRRLGSVAVAVSLGLVMTGCAGWTGGLFQRPGPIECERFIVAAQTALTSADSSGGAAAQNQAVATHDYHACAADHGSEKKS